MAFLMAIAICLQAQSIITTVAGKGRVLTGLGGPATAVPLANPQGIAVDARGNLYIADNTHDVIIRVSSSGVATVFAGTGSPGFSGDGGPATAATLREPEAVAVDAAGDIYIADMRNERIRKVDRNGIITTIAGGGAAYQTDEIPATSQAIFEPFTVAVDASGAVYFNDTGGAIRKVTPDGIVHAVAGAVSSNGFSGDGGLASKALLSGPSGIAFDSSGNLYFADLNNNRVRKIDTKGIISTVAGNGQIGGQIGFIGDGGPALSASFYFPSGTAVDAFGNLYIADQYNYSIRRVTPDGIITTVAGSHDPSFSGDGGPATRAALGRPYGIAIDAAGNLYISDPIHRRIRRVDLSGIIDTVAGNGALNFAGDGGPATQAALDFPTGVKADNGGNLYVADSMNHRIRRIATDGTITTIAGNGTPGFSGDGGKATSAQLNNPVAVAVDFSGNVYISDGGNNRIRRVSPDGVIATYAGNGNAGYSGDGGPATGASFFVLGGLAIDAADNLYVADVLNSRIRKITPPGNDQHRGRQRTRGVLR
ncbi:NHL repeat containing protein (fragment) [Candidatus Sulfopaludibacter sp. SbA3]